MESMVISKIGLLLQNYSKQCCNIDFTNSDHCIVQIVRGKLFQFEVPVSSRSMFAGVSVAIPSPVYNIQCCAKCI